MRGGAAAWRAAGCGHATSNALTSLFRRSMSCLTMPTKAVEAFSPLEISWSVASASRAFSMALPYLWLNSFSVPSALGMQKWSSA